jgi:molybdopterin-guanine dinucleotide biosynthesis protein A
MDRMPSIDGPARGAALGFPHAIAKVSAMERLSSSQMVGVILAGGLSQRMGGGDKGLQPLGRSTMLGVVARRLAPQVRVVILNANGDPQRFADLGLPIVADSVGGRPGPLAGLLAGMRWAGAHLPEATHALTVSSDVPFLPSDLAVRLAAGLPAGGRGIAIASSAGIVHPVIGLWPIALADDLDASLHAGTRKVLAWAERHGAARVDFPTLTVAGETLDPFFNANTPAELDEARRLLELVRM